MVSGACLLGDQSMLWVLQSTITSVPAIAEESVYQNERYFVSWEGRHSTVQPRQS